MVSVSTANEYCPWSHRREQGSETPYFLGYSFALAGYSSDKAKCFSNIGMPPARDHPTPGPVFGLYWQATASTHPLSSAENLMNTCSAAGWSMASCGFAARPAVTKNWWRSVANAAVSVPVAGRAGWQTALTDPGPGFAGSRPPPVMNSPN